MLLLGGKSLLPILDFFGLLVFFMFFDLKSLLPFPWKISSFWLDFQHKPLFMPCC